MSTLSNLGKAIASFAPTLATMLGGPLAGTAVTALAQAFGLSPGATADDVTKVVQAGMTPETIAAVRAADQKHLEILGQQNIDLAKLNAGHDEAFAQIDANDRDSARKREMAVRDHTPAALAYVLTAAVFAMFCALLQFDVPKDNASIVFQLSGLIVATWAASMAYFYGTTSSSKTKDQMLYNSTPKT